MILCPARSAGETPTTPSRAILYSAVPSLRLCSGRALRLCSGRALRLCSGQALRDGSGRERAVIVFSLFGTGRRSVNLRLFPAGKVKAWATRNTENPCCCCGCRGCSCCDTWNAPCSDCCSRRRPAARPARPHSTAGYPAGTVFCRDCSLDCVSFSSDLNQPPSNLPTWATCWLA